MARRRPELRHRTAKLMGAIIGLSVVVVVSFVVALPGGSVVPAPTGDHDAITEEQWARLAWELEGEFSHDAILGRDPKDPRLLRALEESGVSLGAFREAAGRAHRAWINARANASPVEILPSIKLPPGIRLRLPPHLADAPEESVAARLGGATGLASTSTEPNR